MFFGLGAIIAAIFALTMPVVGMQIIIALMIGTANLILSIVLGFGFFRFRSWAPNLAVVSF